MSTSTDAILFYGVILDEDAFPEEAEDDREEYLYSALGAPELPDPEYGTLSYREWKKTPQYAVWKEAYDRRHAFKNACGVELVFFCHIDEPMLGLTLHDKVHRVARGDSMRVTPLMVEPPLEAEVELIRKALVALGQPIDLDEFGWHMVSYWA